MSKKDDDINWQLINNSGGANPEDYLTPKQLKKYQKNPERFINIDIDLAMNNKEDLTQEDMDEYNKRRKEEYDDANNPKDPNDLEEELKKRNQPDPSSGIATPDYSLDSMLYSIVAPKLPKSIGSVGVLLNQLRKKITNPSTVLQLQDEKQPLLSEQTFGTESNYLTRIFGEVTPQGVEYLKTLMMGGKGSGPKKKAKPGPGQMGLDLSYVQLSETIKQPLTEADLTDEDRIRYAQQNAENASVNIEDYLAQFGASTILRKAIRTDMLKPFQKKYGATDEQVRRFAKLANRNTKDIAKTIKYLNTNYKFFQPGLSELRQTNIQDIADEMSIVYGQDITPETIDAIIKGQGGQISYQTDGMKSRGEDPILIKTRQDLLDVYNSRMKLLNTHGAFDKGHVYAADQLLRDNKVSNASMYRNLDAEIRASIRQLVSPIEIKQLIEGQLTKGTDYIEAVIGNRSKKAGGDPGDKVFERLYGNAYGLEEDFRNYLFPKQNLANMIHPDLKSIFGQKYTRIVNQKVKNIEGTGAGPKLQVGSHSLNIIRLEAMKEVLEDYVAGTEITEEEEKAQESLAKVQVFLDFVTGKEMTYKGEIKKGNE